METWATLILSLPTENATVRMRAWRALKSAGAAVLRDGVYLLPDRPETVSIFETVAEDIRASGGQAFVLRSQDAGQENFAPHFDRSGDYAALLAEVRAAASKLSQDTAAEAARQARKLRKSFSAVNAIDFFPGEARKQTEAALGELEIAVNSLLCPGEPTAASRKIAKLDRAKYLGKTWATRRRPWVDRLASAWLIRRFIDPAAKIRWLKQPADCPKTALGFDFDGAAFTHVDAKVTFEVLLASFGLEQPGLQRMAAVVHYLDVGGIQPQEAAGVASVLAGLRESISNDDRLLSAAEAVFDGLLVSFEKNPAA